MLVSVVLNGSLGLLGRGKAHTYKEACKLASIDFCRRYYQLENLNSSPKSNQPIECEVDSTNIVDNHPKSDIVMSNAEEQLPSLGNCFEEEMKIVDLTEDRATNVKENNSVLKLPLSEDFLTQNIETTPFEPPASPSKDNSGTFKIIDNSSPKKGSLKSDLQNLSSELNDNLTNPKTNLKYKLESIEKFSGSIEVDYIKHVCNVHNVKLPQVRRLKQPASKEKSVELIFDLFGKNFNCASNTVEKVLKNLANKIISSNLQDYHKFKASYKNTKPIAKPVIPLPVETINPVPKNINIDAVVTSPVFKINIPTKIVHNIDEWMKNERKMELLTTIVNGACINSSNTCKKLPENVLPFGITTEFLESKSRGLFQDLHMFQQSRNGIQILQQRMSLPIFQYRIQVLEALEKSQILLLGGATGCGKSTQIPNYILEHMTLAGCGAQCNILVTEPRRVAAVSLSQRVAYERGENIGFRVGYIVRFDSKKPEGFGSITYCPSGTLLQILSSNPNLDGYSHVIIDEIHERDMLTDFSLLLLRELLLRRPNIRLIVMSATIGMMHLMEYFGEFATSVISISDPSEDRRIVERFFLEDIVPRLDKKLLSVGDANAFIKDELEQFDRRKSPLNRSFIASNTSIDFPIPYSLLEALIGRICRTTPPNESILVFLPGWDEISMLQKCLTIEDMLREGYGDERRYIICLLHSQMPVEEQEAAFVIPPPGVRKIILSTNIAESSITIEDAVHVIDTAKAKHSRYDSHLSTRHLTPEWISRSSIIQRSGRAGRTTGHGYYYCLMSQHRMSTLSEEPVPEIIRTDLQQVVLMIRSHGLCTEGISTIEEILSKALSAPNFASIRRAIDRLVEIEALTDESQGDHKYQLTFLGELVSRLPLSPSIAKMVIFGIIFRCLDPILTVAAVATLGMPFVSSRNNLKSDTNASFGMPDYRQLFAQSSYGSDFLAAVEVYFKWQDLIKTKEFGIDSCQSRSRESEFCYQNGVSLSALRRIHQLRQQIIDTLYERDIISRASQFFERTRRASKTLPVSSNSAEAFPVELNEYSSNIYLLMAIIAVGFLPNLAVSFNPENHRSLQTCHGERTIMHVSSVNFFKESLNNSFMPICYVYQEKIKTKGLFIQNLSPVSPLVMFSLAIPSLLRKLGRIDPPSTLEISNIVKDIESMRVQQWISFRVDNEINMEQLARFKFALEASTAWILRFLCSSGQENVDSLVNRRSSPCFVNKDFETEQMIYVDKVLRTLGNLLSAEAHY